VPQVRSIPARQAKQAAKGRDVKIGGGVETVRRYLRAGLVDELHSALSARIHRRLPAKSVGRRLLALDHFLFSIVVVITRVIA
jgi:hypothetical protein